MLLKLFMINNCYRDLNLSICNFVIFSPIFMKCPPKCSTEWEIGKYSLHFGNFFFISQGDHWSGTSQGNFIFLHGQGKVREFCKLVREILNTKRVREKSGNVVIFSQNMCCSWYFDNFKCEKSFFFLSLASLARSYENLLILDHSVPRNYLRILFISFVELGRCILVN